MKNIFFAFTIVLFSSCQIKAQDGITKIAANSNVEQTVLKLTGILESKGLKVFSVIDHQKGAQSVSLDLLPTTLVIFGNPKMGTQLMNCNQTVGIDLPMKFLVYEDKDGKTWIAYWKPSLMANTYNLEACQPVLAKMDGALAKFSALAAE